MSPLFRRPALLSFAAFALLSLCLLMAGRTHRAPVPVFNQLRGETPETYFAFDSAQPLAIRFTAPHDRLNGVYFRVLFRAAKHRIALRAFDRSSGELIGENEAGFGVDAHVDFLRPVPAGTEVEIQFHFLEGPEKRVVEAFVKKARSDWPPRIPIEVFAGETALDGAPQLILLYEKPWFWLRHAWWLLPLTLVLAARSPSADWVWLTSLGLVCLLVSWNGWQQRYSGHTGHLDPDRYGKYAGHIARWITEPEAREDVANFTRKYEHAHVALVPAVLSLLLLAGLPLPEAYVWLSALASFAALLIFHHLLRRQLALPPVLALLGVLAFASHLVILRAFARPATDPAGLLLVVAMLAILIDRFRRRTPWQTLATAILVTALVFVRPPGLVYAAFFAGMTVFLDLLRERRLDLRDAALSLAKGTGPAILVAALLYAAFGWSENFQLAMEKRMAFLDQWTPYWFGLMITVTVQGFVLGWFLIRPRDWRPALVLGSWLLLHTLLLVVSQAPFLARLSAPVVPCVVALACLGLHRFWDRLPGRIGGALLLGGFATVNYLIVCWAAGLPHSPPHPLDHWFYA